MKPNLMKIIGALAMTAGLLVAGSILVKAAPTTAVSMSSGAAITAIDRDRPPRPTHPPHPPRPSDATRPLGR